MSRLDSLVGDVINFRGMVYGPVNEQGVVYLFSKVAEDLGFRVEEIRTSYPDCVARRFAGRGWRRVRVEFEFASRNFLFHRHDPTVCDIIVCWIHDWPECPLEVIELRSLLPTCEGTLAAVPFARPGRGGLGEPWWHPLGAAEALALLDALSHRVLAVAGRPTLRELLLNG